MHAHTSELRIQFQAIPSVQVGYHMICLEELGQDLACSGCNICRMSRDPLAAMTAEAYCFLWPIRLLKDFWNIHLFFLRPRSEPLDLWLCAQAGLNSHWSETNTFNQFANVLSWWHGNTLRNIWLTVFGLTTFLQKSLNSPSTWLVIQIKFDWNRLDLADMIWVLSYRPLSAILFKLDWPAANDGRNHSHTEVTGNLALCPSRSRSNAVDHWLMMQSLLQMKFTKYTKGI